ncbi:MAG: hypothetical protein O7D31_10435 [Alphaproteobacteria bacterium]|nr:hypothetical protein [Alphaproteobacteria bacterium]
MNVSFNPHAAAHNPNARPPQTQTTPTATAPAGSGDGVEITLSPAAQQALKAGASDYTGNSPAHMARQYIVQSLDIAQGLAGASSEGADGPDLSGPFGQIVKTFAPGHNKGTAGTGDVVPEDGGDTAGVTDPADGTDGTGGVTDPADGGDGTIVVDGTDATDGTGVVDGSEDSDGGESTVVAGDPDGTVGTDDPPLVVDEPDVTEILDESAPVEGEITEPESGIAGSGDAVASSGDDAPVDDGTPVDAGAPVAVVDGGDLTDELLDLLDEGSEETV